MAYPRRFHILPARSAASLPPARIGPRRFDFYFALRFSALWFALAVLLATLAYLAGWVPAGVAEFGDEIAARIGGGPAAGTAPGAGVSKPAEVLIPGIGVGAPIVFPRSAELGVLNSALTQGVVHYPGSALPGEAGTVFLFGHSTGLAVVHNRNFAVFNRLRELGPGSMVRLRYGEREYWYKVRSVDIKRADAAVVDLQNTGPGMLVLSTCRIFGALDERFVVTAEFVESYPLRGDAAKEFLPA